MTLIVTVFVPSGIAVSADSRTTLNIDLLPDNQKPGSTAERQQHVVSDAAQKLFCIFGRFGVGMLGNEYRFPIERELEKMEGEASVRPATTRAVCDVLLQHFGALKPVPNVGFFVAGYDGETPRVFLVRVATNAVEQKNDDFGFAAEGEIRIVGRLLDRKSPPPFAYWNLQNAIDFSRHLIRTTIEHTRFEPSYSGVGGPIDTLVVTPSGLQFISKKELSV